MLLFSSLCLDAWCVFEAGEAFIYAQPEPFLADLSVFTAMAYSPNATLDIVLAHSVSEIELSSRWQNHHRNFLRVPSLLSLLPFPANLLSLDSYECRASPYPISLTDGLVEESRHILH